MKTENEKKSRRPRQGQRPGISVKKYEQVYQAFLEDQNIKSVAKHCGIDPRTARRYIEHGDPTRGMRPVRERFAEVLRRAQEREDTDTAKALAENLRLVRQYKQILAAKLDEQLSVDGKTLTPRASRELPAELSGAMERMIRLEMSLLGEPDVKVETTSWFDGWTREEMYEYGRSGRVPERLLSGRGQR